MTTALLGTTAMPAVKIQPGVWKDLVVAAERQRRKPETLANQALQDYLARMADEELLTRSARAARRSPLRAAETEDAIRRYRRNK
jgi:hypothetical protein